MICYFMKSWLPTWILESALVHVISFPQRYAEMAVKFEPIRVKPGLNLSGYHDIGRTVQLRWCWNAETRTKQLSCWHQWYTASMPKSVKHNFYVRNNKCLNFISHVFFCLGFESWSHKETLILCNAHWIDGRYTGHWSIGVCQNHLNTTAMSSQ